MKAIFLSAMLLGLGLLSPLASAQSAPAAFPLAGDWDGVMVADEGVAHHLVLHLNTTPEGKMTALMDDLDLKVSGIPATGGSFDGSHLTLRFFYWKPSSSNPTLLEERFASFEATVNESGSGMTGVWTQKGSRPLNFKRITWQAKVPKPAPPTIFDGDWSGIEYERPGHTILFILHLHNTEDGLMALLDCPEEKFKGALASKVTYDQASREITITIGMSIFTGKMTADGKALDTSMTEPGFHFLIHFDRLTAGSQAPPPTYSLTSTNMLQQMSPGINLGNTLEAIDSKAKPPATASQETSWGNPAANQAIFDAYKAAGFRSVRIPVAWSQYADANNDISPFWMARVKQVVDEARKSGLYVIINVHWDGGWMDHPTYAQQSAINAKLAKFWTQIAGAFKDYDDHLLFAGTNEVGQENTYGPPTAEYCAVQNSFNQTFVNTVRPTGGYNATRFLVVQGYNTNIDSTVSCDAKLPADTVPSRLAMEVHYYDPYNFTINGSSTVWQWGQSVPASATKESWADETWVDSAFQKMKTAFVEKGVPVILGEYGVYLKPAYPGMNSYRQAWIQYVTKSMVSHGLAPMWWDTGELFDRTTGAPKTTDAIQSIVNSAK